MMMREREKQRGAASSETSGDRQLSRLVTEVLAPAPIASALLVFVAFHSTSTTIAAFGWALLAALFSSILPLTYVLWGVRRRRLSDRHVGSREQRLFPLLIGIGSIVVGLALLTALGAPGELVALVAAMTAGLIVSLLITLVWKISMHTAVAAGAVTIVALVFGSVWLVLMLLVGLVGWARVELDDHTPAQVVAGAGVGAIVAAAVFTVLR
jgi:membrane-associated phospholipid phosphatase